MLSAENSHAGLVCFDLAKFGLVHVRCLKCVAQLVTEVSREAAQVVRCPQIGSVASVHTLDKNGKREIVGYGWNGTACYYDRADHPMPAVRFREPTNEIINLHQKEKGDWKKMGIDEKKALYRASFCQTFAEIQAPTGEFKKHFGLALAFHCHGHLDSHLHEFVRIR
uniref:Cytochrome c oxidase subunit 4 n=1 Tax=Glossina morsitans morsitans TaxID=37546 RepID=A0A1B0G064_GLOMM